MIDNLRHLPQPEFPTATPEPAVDDAVGPAKSWQPVDLDPYLRGEAKRPEPVIGLARTDGLRLIYPSKEHAVIGEMEAGKSWLLLASAAAEIAAGNHVIYVHFEEADPTDTVERLIALGAAAQDIDKLFHFVAPDVPGTVADLARLLAHGPTLVILDGVNEAMSLHGWKIRDEDGAAAFRRYLVKPCTTAGAAVLSADHVVKDRETRGRNALGSIHKGNGLTGSLILLENAEPFGRGERGRSHVYVTKDRPGHLRRHGQPTKLPGKTFMGELTVDDTRRFNPWLELSFWAPAAKAGSETADPTVDEALLAERREVDEHVLAVVNEIITAGDTATVRTVRARSKYGFAKTADALERLLLDRQLCEKAGPRRSRIFTVTGSQDQTPAPVDRSTGSVSGAVPRRGAPAPHHSPTGADRFSTPVSTTRNQSRADTTEKHTEDRGHGGRKIE